MVLSGIKIIRVSDTKCGTSETTGRSWASKSVLLGFEDETGESYVYVQVDEDVWKKLGFEAGQVVTLNLKFRTRKFASGFIANDIRIINPENI